MMKLRFGCLLVLLMISASGCKGYSEVSINQLDKYFDESLSHSFHVWYLEKEDQSFYYLKRKSGVVSNDYFKVRKAYVTIDIKEKLPVALKSGDFKKKITTNKATHNNNSKFCFHATATGVAANNNDVSITTFSGISPILSLPWPGVY